MNKRQIIITSIGLAILISSYVISKILGGMKEPPRKQIPIEAKKFVKTAAVVYGDVNTWITAYGRVETARQLDMIAEVSGRMREGAVSLKEGQSFRKGSLIYSIDDTEARLNLSAQKSNFLREIASILPDLKIDFSDNYQAWDDYFQSIDIEKELPVLPNFKSTKEKTYLATRNIFSNYYTIKSAEANLRKYRFYAPFEGSISNVNLQSGSYVNPGNNIAKLVMSNNLEIKVSVDLRDIVWIEKGSPVKITTDNNIHSWKGVVSRIGEVVNQTTQSINVYVSIIPGGPEIYDGTYLQAQIPGAQVKDAMVIPRNAIFNQDEVFILEDSLLKVKQITLHKLNPETAIFSGLKEGSEVVVEPLINAHNNMRAYKLNEKNDINIEGKEDPQATMVKN